MNCQEIKWNVVSYSVLFQILHDPNTARFKGVFSKPSGNRIVAQFFFELETSNFGYLLIFIIL